jgi:hypothetical protein
LVARVDAAGRITSGHDAHRALGEGRGTTLTALNAPVFEKKTKLTTMFKHTTLK